MPTRPGSAGDWQPLDTVSSTGLLRLRAQPKHLAISLRARSRLVLYSMWVSLLTCTLLNLRNETHTAARCRWKIPRMTSAGTQSSATHKTPLRYARVRHRCIRALLYIGRKERGANHCAINQLWTTSAACPQFPIPFSQIFLTSRRYENHQNPKLLKQSRNWPLGPPVSLFLLVPFQ